MHSFVTHDEYWRCWEQTALMHREIPVPDTSQETCPVCHNKGHTVRSHQSFHAGDVVMVIDDNESFDSEFDDLFRNIVGTYLYQVVLNDGRVADMESIVLIRRGPDAFSDQAA